MFENNHLYCEDLNGCAQYIDIKKDSSVLVTGATGLIGTFIVDTLVNYNKKSEYKIHVTATGRNIERLKSHFDYCAKEPMLTFLQWDANNELPADRHYDYIIHLASNADPRSYALYPVETITTNFFGGINVLKYLEKEKDCKAVFASTFEVYGTINDKDSFEEDDYGLVDYNQIRSGYPESKRAMELMVRSSVSEYDVKAVIARLGGIYGPTMHSEDNKAVAQFIRKSSEGENIVLKSTGAQRRSYLYVADCVSGILTCLFKGVPGEAYNVGNPKSEVSIKEMAENAAKAAGTEVVFELPDDLEKKGFGKAQDSILNPDKLMRLGYSPKYDAKEGLKRTISIFSEGKK